MTGYCLFAASIGNYTHFFANPTGAALVAGEPAGPTKNGMFQALRRHNLGIGFRNFADSGDEAELTLIDVQREVPNLPIGTPCVVHSSGNNVSGLGPFAGWTQAQRDSLSSVMRQIYETILNAGMVLIPIPLTYRNYGEGGDRLQNQDRAGLVNDNIIMPLIQELAPETINPVTGRSHIDWHRVSALADLDDNYFFNRDIDNIHPFRDTGVPVLQEELARGLTAIPGLNFPPVQSGRRIHFTAATDGINDAPPVNNHMLERGSVLTDLIDETGAVLPGSSIELIGWQGGGSGGIAVASPFFPNQSHFGSVAARFFVGGNGSVRITIPELAGMNAIAKIVGAEVQQRSNRVGIFSITSGTGPDAVTQSGVVNAGLNPPVPAEIPFTFDESGTVVINSTPDAVTGSTFNYLNGLTLEIPDPVIPNAASSILRPTLRSTLSNALR